MSRQSQANRLLVIATVSNVVAFGCIAWSMLSESDTYDTILLGVGAGLFITSSFLLWQSLQRRRPR